MTEQLYALEKSVFDASRDFRHQKEHDALEEGKLIYCPHDVFTLNEEQQDYLFSSYKADKSHKNISYNYLTQKIGGFQASNPEETRLLETVMQNYAVFARQLVEMIIPSYKESLIWGRTSYRPAEIAGRVLSKRKDDTRLHVDAFPATPVYGRRILRVFCNINPYEEPRVWHLGEPFAEVIKRFAPHLPRYRPSLASLLYRLKATKTYRSAYDHYQLALHDAMKLDESYQQTVTKERFLFKAQSTWIVFTDQVSHAALSGQFLLEQTFYLPVEAMRQPELSPWFHWKNCTLKNGKALLS